MIHQLNKLYPEQIIVRLPKSEQKGIQAFYERIFKKNFKKIIIDRNSKIADSLDKSKVVITSWDSTVFLECLNAGIPTIAYWDKKKVL